MVLLAKKIDYQVLNNEFEALLVEADLIRLHQPKFNVLLKDDKSPIYLQITPENYPRILIKRKQDLKKTFHQGQILGPFASSHKLSQVLKIVRPIFPWCNQKQSKSQSKPCFYYHLNLCPGACINLILEKDYQKNIKELVLFLRGKKQTLIKQLKKEIILLIKEQAFEKANINKQKIQLIEEVTNKKFQFKPIFSLSFNQKNEIKEALLALKQMLITYSHIPRDYQLNRIEAYDVSNIQGSNAAVSMIVFNHGETSKKDYRLFNIKTIDTPNDYQMIKEAISRRSRHQEWSLPNLIVIDGGKGQIRAALSVWPGNQPIIGLVKNPDRIVIPIHQLEKNHVQEKKYQIIKLAQNHPTLKLLQSIRNEAHRFAKKQHQRLRIKNFIKIS